MNLRLFFLALLFMQSTQAASTSKTLTIAIIQEWGAFNPITNQLASTQALLPLVVRNMVKRAANGSVIADVAESVPLLKKDNKAVWTIRATAKWADGQTITCADWHLGWKTGLNPKVSVESRSYYDKIKNIEWTEKEPKICTVTYASNDWSYDRDLPPFLPSHFEKTIADKFKDEPEGYDRNTNYIANPTNKSLYNGPYYISDYKLGSHVVFTRNPNFMGPQAHIEKIIVKHISDTSALKANLASGQINAISAVGFPPDTALMMDEEFRKENSDFAVRFQNSGIFQGVYFNLESEFFKDAKVRQALSLAINKDQIVKAFFNNKLEVAESILSPQHPAYRKQASHYSKDQANKLLDEAGWKKSGPNGERSKNNKVFNVVFKTSAGLKVLENIQVYICEQFKSIGVQCTIKNEPPRVLLGQSVPHGEFDLAMFGQPIPPDTSISSYFSSKDIPTAQNSWAGGNQIRLNSKELDQMLLSFDKENNKFKRNSIIQKIEAYLQNNYLMIPLYHRREAIVMPKGVRNITDSYDGTGYANPELWTWN